MFAIVTLEYIVPLEEVLPHVEEHRAYLRALHAEGKIVASGPLVPRTGGVLIVHAADAEELARIVRDDPFKAKGIARYEAREFTPVIGEEGLKKALERPLA